jgi:uncharacterized membrane protein (DUF4010 family)
VVFARVLLEMGTVAPDLFRQTAPPLMAQGAVLAILCLGLQRMARSEIALIPAEDDPPSDLRTPIVFGLLYAGILLTVAWARQNLGTEALYAVAFVSGLADMDAITLSTMELSRGGGLEPGTAWRVILVASMSNLAFKGAVVAAMGSRQTARWVALLFGTTIVAGGIILFAWPG